MPSTPAYSRVLLKMSGEMLAGPGASGIDPATIQRFAREIGEVRAMGVEICVVVGGGNIFRGLAGASRGMDRAHADYMGMLATVINAMALQSALEAAGVDTRLQSAIELKQIAEPFIRRRAVRHLEKGRVVIFGAGTGNPFFTTDSAASLRAVEIDADVILKGTRVDGIYTADPERDPNAERFDRITFSEVFQRGLKVMDMTAFTLFNENNLPILVFDMIKPGNLQRIVEGESIGTVVEA